MARPVPVRRVSALAREKLLLTVTVPSNVDARNVETSFDRNTNECAHQTLLEKSMVPAVDAVQLLNTGRAVLGLGECRMTSPMRKSSLL